MNGEARLIDTDVPVQAYTVSDDEKHRAALTLIEGVWSGEGATTTLQNLCEFFFVATRKVEKPISASTGEAIVKGIMAGSQWRVIDRSPETVFKAIELVKLHRAPLWDALIAACMLEQQVHTIITENERDFRRIPGIVVVNPFRAKAKRRREEEFVATVWKNLSHGPILSDTLRTKITIGGWPVIFGNSIGISSGGWHEVTEVICGVSMATRKEQILIILNSADITRKSSRRSLTPRTTDPANHQAAVEEDGARAAFSDHASDMRSGQAGDVAEKVGQEQAWLDLLFVEPLIDFNLYRQSHRI